MAVDVYPLGQGDDFDAAADLEFTGAHLHYGTFGFAVQSAPGATNLTRDNPLVGWIPLADRPNPNVDPTDGYMPWGVRAFHMPLDDPADGDNYATKFGFLTRPGTGDVGYLISWEGAYLLGGTDPLAEWHVTVEAANAERCRIISSSSHKTTGHTDLSFTTDGAFFYPRVGGGGPNVTITDTPMTVRRGLVVGSNASGAVQSPVFAAGLAQTGKRPFYSLATDASEAGLFEFDTSVALVPQGAFLAGYPTGQRTDAQVLPRSAVLVNPDHEVMIRHHPDPGNSGDFLKLLTGLSSVTTIAGLTTRFRATVANGTRLFWPNVQAGDSPGLEFLRVGAYQTRLSFDAATGDIVYVDSSSGSDAEVVRFERGTGIQKTKAVAAGNTLGAVTGKLPVKGADGVTRYLPLYDDITVGPELPPDTANVLAWGPRGSGYFQNTAKTTPADAAGEPVRVWSCDALLAGKADAVAPDDAARPVLGTTQIAGVGLVPEFSATPGHWLRLPRSLLDGRTEFTLAARFRVNNDGERHVVGAGFNLNGTFLGYLNGADTPLLYTDLGGGASAQGPQNARDADVTVVAVYDGANLTVYQNNVADPPVARTGTISLHADDAVGVGGTGSVASGAGAFFVDGAVAEYVIWDVAFDAAEAEAAYDFLTRLT